MTPIIWSIAGTDSAGGAGLAADQRAADAFGVHLCPVVAAVTAQNSTAVTHIEPLTIELLNAQLAALADDMPPHVIKTGLLGSAANAMLVARWVDRLRERGPVQLVIDPVLRASTGADFADTALLQAYREHLLPRAHVITPNRQEALRLLGARVDMETPATALALQAMGAAAVLVTGGDAATPGLALDWLQTPHAQGWLSLPRVDTAHHHGTGCTFATSLAAALARGFVAADAAVLAKMATTQALRHSRAVGAGAGPVVAVAGFATDPSLLPRLSLDASAPDTWHAECKRGPDPGVYAIVDSAERVEAVLRAGGPRGRKHHSENRESQEETGLSGEVAADTPSRVQTPWSTVATIQLRMKRPIGLSDARWAAQLRQAIQRSQCAADAAGATLVINDHWQIALAAGARALHLGQEDLLALKPADQMQLQTARAQGAMLGLSSHSLWELCRAAALTPDYIACGPVWPTTTKDMPWVPQGLDNLAWWVHMSPAPVVGIGGILTPDRMRAVAGAGAAGGCVVRGLGDDDPANRLPDWLSAWQEGQRRSTTPIGVNPQNNAHGWPHPSLPHHHRPHGG